MPRRSRRGNGAEAQSARPPANDTAISTRIQTLFKKIMVALQDQRDLRCDLSSTRTRAFLLDSEYVVLHAEYERSLAARDKLEALSRELARQNKIIDEESEARILEEKRMREEIGQRFNVAMMDTNKKLARQSSSREQREAYLSNLQNKLSDLRESYDMREEHFRQQVHRKKLEKRLAEAKKREVELKHATIASELSSIRENLTQAHAEHDDLSDKLQTYHQIIQDGEHILENSQHLFDRQKTQIEDTQAEVKRLQAKNAAVRKQNSLTVIQLKGMDIESRRLEKVIAEHQELERKERTTAEALDKLCKQVTNERTELHNEIKVMQDAWTNLKQEIEALKDQDGDGNRVLEVLQNIMTRESVDVVVDNYLKDRKSLEEVVTNELAHLRLAAGRLQEQAAAIGSAGGRAAASQDVDPPG
eukprot:GFKZ01012377.1.p1 GENE.GFKZ01012377.1~~GFKZ01012377.1.p1  ORF type:complete len:418 (+),score=85.74 GFKZ01012377.1:476-1729(+)